MAKLQWKSLTSHEGSPFLTWLYEATRENAALFREMGRFVTVRIPQLWQEWLGSLSDAALFVCRAGYHLSRFIAGVLGWLGILLAPMFFHPGWLAAIWLVLVLAATGWAARQVDKKTKAQAAAKKEGFNARA
jgi:hypothetical protein